MVLLLGQVVISEVRRSFFSENSTKRTGKSDRDGPTPETSVSDLGQIPTRGRVSFEGHRREEGPRTIGSPLRPLLRTLLFTSYCHQRSPPRPLSSRTVVRGSDTVVSRANLVMVNRESSLECTKSPTPPE